VQTSGSVQMKCVRARFPTTHHPITAASIAKLRERVAGRVAVSAATFLAPSRRIAKSAWCVRRSHSPLCVCSSWPARGRKEQFLRPAASASSWNSIANGRAIFQTGKDLAGVQTVAQHPPLYERCAACHRADGSGGVHFSDDALSADLRHSALMFGQKHPYTLALLERAISTGIDNDGKKLDPVMPRWKLSPRDLHDVSQYVLKL
jgi:mono/diheme cytochrome c family protein